MADIKQDLLSDAAGVTLSDSATVQMNLVCTTEASLSLGAIAGILTATDLSGKKELLVVTTKTNEAGKYLFLAVLCAANTWSRPSWTGKAG